MSETKESAVETFVRDIIAVGGVFNVDDMGYIINKGDIDEPVTVKVGNQRKPLMILKEKGIDNAAAIINPFNGDITESIESKWLYVMLNAGLVRRIKAIAKFVSEVVESEKAENPIPGLSSETLTFISKHKNFDDVVYKQFLSLTDDPTKFMSIWYNRKLKETIFRCSIYDTATKIEFPQIKPKIWKIIIDFVSALLGVSTNLEQAEQQVRELYSAKSEIVTAPKLDSMIMVYIKLYTQLNPYLVMCERIEDQDFVVDITSLGYHLEHLEEYYKRAKWFVTSSSSIPSRTQTVSGVTQNPSQIESKIPVNPAMAQFEVPQMKSNIPMNPAMTHANPQMGYSFGGGQIVQQGYQQPFNHFQQNVIPTAGFQSPGVVPTTGFNQLIPTRF